MTSTQSGYPFVDKRTQVPASKRWGWNIHSTRCTTVESLVCQLNCMVS